MFFSHAAVHLMHLKAIDLEIFIIVSADTRPLR